METEKKPVNIRIDADEYALILELSRKRKSSISSTIRYLMSLGLNQNEKTQ